MLLGNPIYPANVNSESVDIIDKDKLPLSEKPEMPNQQQMKIMENIINEYIALYRKDKWSLIKTIGKLMGRNIEVSFSSPLSSFHNPTAHVK